MPLYIVTLRLPKDPSRPHALSCRHQKMTEEGHCFEIGCPNYRSSCPRHSITGRGESTCTRKKKTGPCPVNMNENCTDCTGEHHTVLVEAENTDLVRKALKERGYDNITRMERGWALKVG